MSFLLFMCLFPSQSQGGLYKPFVVPCVTDALPHCMAVFPTLHGYIW